MKVVQPYMLEPKLGNKVLWVNRFSDGDDTVVESLFPVLHVLSFWIFVFKSKNFMLKSEEYLVILVLWFKLGLVEMLVVHLRLPLRTAFENLELHKEESFFKAAWNISEKLHFYPSSFPLCYYGPKNWKISQFGPF